jgi:hypothetical protein
MNFFTKTQLRRISEYDLRYPKAFSAFVHEQRGNNKFDIFLSHSFSDKEFIKGLYIALSNRGFSVYVDWIIDPELSRNNVTKSTVNQIRKRMRQSKSLVYATSENASKSKWMPWELGHMDGDKQKCAILPITDHSYDSFRGQEFLSVYPIVGLDDINGLLVQEDKYSTDGQKLNNWII